MENEDSTKEFMKEMRKLLEDYEEKTGVAIERIDISWIEDIGGPNHLNEIRTSSYTRGF